VNSIKYSNKVQNTISSQNTVRVAAPSPSTGESASSECHFRFAPSACPSHGQRLRLPMNATRNIPEEQACPMKYPCSENNVEIQLLLERPCLVPKFERNVEPIILAIGKLTSDAGALRASVKEHHRNDACWIYIKVGKGRWNDLKRRREKTKDQRARRPK
jgi:hypothetical protein